MTTYRLSELISPAFFDVHRAVKSKEYTQYVLRGGRGSTKSSYVSLEAVLELIKHPDIHAVVMRKVANTLRTSVYAQYVWAISELGCYDKFKFTVSPMEITYKPTGQKIMFFGADDPGKVKSLKVPRGYVGILHFEELDQFAGDEEIRNLEQSILRGGEIALEFKTFNPPQSAGNWANQYCLSDKPNQLIHSSSYLSTPAAWLGQRFLDDAEYLRQTNPRAYEHEYLGVPNGTGGAVFNNLSIRTITDAELDSLPRRYHGIDWGYYPDPFAFVSCAYNAGTRTLYVYDELILYKHGNEQAAEKLREKDIDGMIYADSAEPKSIADFRGFGFNNIRPVEKGRGSVDYTHKWLCGQNSIVIDGSRCPIAAKEFSQYEYERTKAGEIISGYPDSDNHTIDAVRYAMNPVWRVRAR